jgi:hypothetical protein
VFPSADPSGAPTRRRTSRPGAQLRSASSASPIIGPLTFASTTV